MALDLRLYKKHDCCCAKSQDVVHSGQHDGANELQMIFKLSESDRRSHTFLTQGIVNIYPLTIISKPAIILIVCLF
jgi:hypothetical protein